MRVNGTASIEPATCSRARVTPQAQFIVRVSVREVFPNCPRYIHKYQLVERSKFVPRAERSHAGAGVETLRMGERRAAGRAIRRTEKE